MRTPTTETAGERAIARVIDVPVPGEPPTPSHAHAVPTTDFLKRVLPNHRVEHVARERITMTRHQPLESWAGTSLFFGSLHRAFQGHFGIALRPEVVWYLVMDVVATVVKRHPDAYGEWFSDAPATRKRVHVQDDTLVLGDPSSNWGHTIGAFDQSLRDVVPDGIMDVLLPDLSTATPETRAASLVAFMDAASPFHRYSVGTLCGIPRIRLDGAPEDWATVARHATALRTVFGAHLDWYFDELVPVLETIAEQAAGAPLDERFWRSIYNFDGNSGRQTINGWSTALLGHVLDRRAKGLIEKASHLRNWARDGIGMPICSSPSHVSSVEFEWEYRHTPYPMKFVGGVLGVDLEDETTLVPRLSYAVVHRLA